MFLPAGGALPLLCFALPKRATESLTCRGLECHFGKRTKRSTLRQTNTWNLDHAPPMMSLSLKRSTAKHCHLIQAPPMTSLSLKHLKAKIYTLESTTLCSTQLSKKQGPSVNYCV